MTERLYPLNLHRLLDLKNMKTRPMSLPEKIRSVRKSLHHWMGLRQQNPIMSRDPIQETAERESLRLAGVLDQLEQRQSHQMASIELSRSEGRL